VIYVRQTNLMEVVCEQVVVTLPSQILAIHSTEEVLIVSTKGHVALFKHKETQPFKTFKSLGIPIAVSQSAKYCVAIPE
jgi:hypothetical protein